jgi:hypothetical protein
MLPSAPLPEISAATVDGHYSAGSDSPVGHFIGNHPGDTVSPAGCAGHLQSGKQAGYRPPVGIDLGPYNVEMDHHAVAALSVTGIGLDVLGDSTWPTIYSAAITTAIELRRASRD